VRGRITVNNAEAYIACCLAGLGLIQIPAYDVRRHLNAGELVEVMPNHRAEPMPMTLLYPHLRHLSHIKPAKKLNLLRKSGNCPIRA
jgi:LysR family transcriptional regulator for bpeEF and oprC